MGRPKKTLTAAELRARAAALEKEQAEIKTKLKEAEKAEGDRLAVLVGRFFLGYLGNPKSVKWDSDKLPPEMASALRSKYTRASDRHLLGIADEQGTNGASGPKKTRVRAKKQA